MAKKNMKKKQKSKGNAGGSRAMVKADPMGGSMAFKMAVCALTNPFCPEAVGSRWPDNSYTKSVGWSVTNAQQTITTNAAGQAANLYLAALNGQYSAGSVAASVVTYTNISAMQTTPTNVSRWRLTSYGIKISCISAPMTTTGVCRIRLFSPLTGTTMGTTSIGTNMADASLDVPLSRLIDKDIFVNAAPLGGMSRLFVANDTVTTMAAYVNPGFQLIQVGVDGAPASTAVLNVSVYHNYEFIFAEGDAQVAFTQPPPPDNPVVRQATAGTWERVGNFVSSTAEGVNRVYESAAGRAIMDVGMSIATRGLVRRFPRILGGAAAAAPAIMVD